MAGQQNDGTVGMCSSGVGKELPAWNISKSVQLDFMRSRTCLRKRQDEWAGRVGRAGRAGRVGRADGRGTTIA